jgi:hypothetical protein
MRNPSSDSPGFCPPVADTGFSSPRSYSDAATSTSSNQSVSRNHPLATPCWIYRVPARLNFHALNVCSLREHVLTFLHNPFVLMTVVTHN